MADDNVDLRFLGRQVLTLQVNVHELRAANLRLDGDVVGLRAEIETKHEATDGRLDRIEQQVRSGFQAVDLRFAAVDATLRSIDARFEQVNQTMATNRQVILAAIGK